MDRERLFNYLEQRYISKREMIARIPLSAQADAIWQELLNRRRSRGTVLPINNRVGKPYWYMTTEKMVAASEKIVETLLENEKEFDPYTDAPAVATLEEVFYTSYVDGSRMTMPEAMTFLQSESPPRDVEELLIVNNRQAGNFASSNLYRSIDEGFLKELIFLLTDGIDGGGSDYRSIDQPDFSSMEGESFELPRVESIPQHVQELVSFLSDPYTHPLIKAATAHIWAAMIQPFPEGNERLGRMLSTIILLRAGYTFFSEISLSALIARKGYGYYEAIANSLREENGSDLTYFFEYFFELLSRAIDERRLRISQKENQALAAEQEMAKAPLSAANPDPDPKSPDPPTPPLYPRTCLFPVEDDEPIPRAKEEGTPLEKLQGYARNPSRVIGAISALLLQRIEEGVDIVFISEITEELNLSPIQLSSSIRYLKQNGILQDAEKINRKKAYRILCNNKSSPDDGAAPEITERLEELSRSNSQKDKRIAATITACMDKGEITLADYEERGQSTKWGTDMAFAAQLGLVEKINPQKYRVLREFKKELPALSKSQKKIITDLYDSFGEGTFSIEMVVATLDYSGSHASAVLHQFTLLKLIDCQVNLANQFQYTFLINPQDHPECFEEVA